MNWKWQLAEFGQSHSPRIIAARSVIGKQVCRDILSFVKLRPSSYDQPFTLVDETSCLIHRVWTPRRSILMEVARWEADRLPKMTSSGVTWRGTARCMVAFLRKDIAERKVNPHASWHWQARHLREFQRYLGLIKEAKQ